MLHLNLIRLIKQEEGWGLTQENQWEINKDISDLNKQETIRRLVKFWKEHKEKDKVIIEGIVKTILPSGREGFVRDMQGNDYYFNFRDALCRHECLVKDSKVVFVLEDRLDKKRNVWKKNAVEIKSV